MLVQQQQIFAAVWMSEISEYPNFMKTVLQNAKYVYLKKSMDMVEW